MVLSCSYVYTCISKNWKNIIMNNKTIAAMIFAAQERMPYITGLCYANIFVYTLLYNKDNSDDACMVIII